MSPLYFLLREGTHMGMLRTSMLIGASFAFLSTPSVADPLSGGWKPKPNANRASIASLMLQQQQMRNPMPSYAGAIFTCGGTGGGGSGGQAGDGSQAGAGGNSNTASATANNNCTIVVGSDGTVISVDQISDGDQTSNANSEIANNEAGQSLSSILESME